MVAFGNKDWKVTKGSMVVVRGNMVGTLYLLTNTYNDVINLASIGKNVIMGHHRLRHVKKNEL